MVDNSGDAGGWQEVRSGFGLDLRSLGFFRIGLGLVLLYDLWVRACSLTIFYSDRGVWSRLNQFVAVQDLPSISLHMISGDVWVQGCLFALAGLLSLALLVGYQTRAVTIGSWLMLLSLHSRNEIVLHSGDHLLVALLFWAMFLPVGARFSVDAWAHREAGHAGSGEQSIVTVGTFALIVQICSLYAFSALLKSGAEWTRDGTATYYALHLDMMARPLGVYLREYPEFLKVATFAVHRFELFGPLLLIVPFWGGALRGLGVLCFMALHIGFLFTLDLGIFAYCDLVALVALLPTWCWQQGSRFVLWTGQAPKRLIEWIEKAKVFFGWFVQVLLHRLPPPAEPHPKLRPFTRLFVVVMVVYVFSINLGTIKPNLALSDAVQAPAEIIGMAQRWAMFAPGPSNSDDWLVIVGQLRNGEVVDLYKWLNLGDVQASVSWRKPAALYKSFKNARFNDYTMNLLDLEESNPKGTKPHWQSLSVYLCREWTKQAPKSRELLRLDAYIVRELSPPPGQPQAKPKRARIWSYPCHQTKVK